MELKAIKTVIRKEVRSYDKDPELQVEFYMDIPIGVAEILQDESINEFSRVVMFLEHIIADWNFADSNGNKLEINETNIKILGADLVKWIVKEATEIVKPNEDKKK